MRYALSLTIAGTLLAQGSFALGFLPEARNFIYIVPDGFGIASQSLARDYVSLLQNGENPKAPVSIQLPADEMVIGNVRTLASDNLITDSAASATAFGCGVKTYNDAIAVDVDGKPVASILEAAKADGFKTGLVVTSTINHATPACYAAHVADRDSYEKIAEHEIGYSHPLGPQVDILLGGGRCYFKPKSDPTSCRKDDIDLFGFAKERGFRVMQDRKAFDELKKGHGKAAELPYIGLFNDGQMMYEIDRKQQPNKEPSLLEMVDTAVTSLDRATKKSSRGYFLMIEASRIDHAGHANDPVGHLHDVIMYNDVMKFVRKWIDKHPDTVMMSAADHETGGLTLNGFNPLPLKAATMTTEHAGRLWKAYNGTDRRAYLKNTILPGYGLGDLPDAEVDTILKNDKLASDLSTRLSKKAGINWSTGGHTAADITLYGYGNGWRGDDLKLNMAGNWDNTQLPAYIERVLKVNIKKVTEKLRKAPAGWVGKRNLSKRGHSHEH
ncbi:alkaline phosphatase [Cucurbitaria berberidis CBS 394.84]|uniref:Alkaline phosphatase n=1 Tax=Cucurbitaria berberidis CBS 394.84 TaxID=1168544 RepID=A0A9P4GPB2_9PLEO|nr:alkaline phosphatase [Cucurbitaria berberidis CBS 394.84]KAF1850153.1 alkaline phosphatase [Cucurbitaria berberidis CBS 394.84]